MALPLLFIADALSDVGDEAKYIQPVELLQRKKDKIQKKGSRTAVVGNFGLYMFQSKKMQSSFNLLDIHKIKSPSAELVEFCFESDSLLVGVQDAAKSENGENTSLDGLIDAARASVRLFYPGKFERGYFCSTTIEPIDRLKYMDDVPIDSTQFCDGLMSAYAFTSHRHHELVPPHVTDDLQNFVERTAGNDDDGCLDMVDLASLQEPKAFVCLIDALAHNRWLKEFRMMYLPLKFEVGPLVSYSATLTSLTLVGVGATKDDAMQFAAALGLNDRLALRELDLSQNNIEDRGVVALATCLSKMRKGLTRLRLNECGAGRQGLMLLLTTLENHHFHGQTMLELALSRNRAGADVGDALQRFLRHAHTLQRLELADLSELDPEQFLRAELCPQFCLALKHLDLSGMPLPSPDLLPNTVAFFAAAKSLEHVALARTGGPAIVATLVELVCRLRALKTLDISGIVELADDMTDLLGFLRASPTLAVLHIDGTVRSKSKGATEFVLGLAALLSSACPLVSLRLAVNLPSDAYPASNTNTIVGVPLRARLIPLFESLANNKALLDLDITGHQIGDIGARLLANALRANETLKILRCDQNNITIDGYAAILSALRHNSTLTMFEYPIHDVSVANDVAVRAPRNSGQTVHSLRTILSSIQDIVRRNAERGATASSLLNLLSNPLLETVRAKTTKRLESLMRSSNFPASIDNNANDFDHQVLSGQLAAAGAAVLGRDYVSYVRGVVAERIAEATLQYIEDVSFDSKSAQYISRSSLKPLSSCDRCHALHASKKYAPVGCHARIYCATCARKAKLAQLKGATSSMEMSPSGALTFTRVKSNDESWQPATPPTQSPRTLNSDRALGARRQSDMGRQSTGLADSSSSSTNDASTRTATTPLKRRVRRNARDSDSPSGSHIEAPTPRKLKSHKAKKDKEGSSSPSTLTRRSSKADDGTGVRVDDESTDTSLTDAGSSTSEGKLSRVNRPRPASNRGTPGSLRRLRSNTVDSDKPFASPPSRIAPTPRGKAPSQLAQMDEPSSPAPPVPSTASPLASSTSAVPNPKSAHREQKSAATTLTNSELEKMSRAQRRQALQESARQRPKKLDKWGFAVDTMKSQRNQSVKEREKEAERAEKWAPMIVEWPKYWKKQQDQTKERFRKGLPDSLRGPLYRLVCDSDALRDANPGLYAKLCRKESKQFGSQIARDIDRTFPEHVFFKDTDGLGQTGLYKILNAYCLYDRDTGYTQGMGFVTGLLLIYMSEENAFFTLVKLMKEFELSGLFSPGFPRLHEMFYVQSALVKTHLPQIHNHFQELDIETKVYAFQWFSTLFLYALPFHLVIRIWDYFLVDRFKAVFSVALALLKMNQALLLSCDWEQAMEVLFAFDKIEMDASDLIQTAVDFKLKEDRLQRYSLEYHKQLQESKDKEEKLEADRLVQQAANAKPTIESNSEKNGASEKETVQTEEKSDVVDVPKKKSSRDKDSVPKSSSKIKSKAKK